MVDNTDDWWDDKPAFWSGVPPQNKMEYRILRAKKESTFGSPGFTVQWVVFAVYDTKRKRDSALSALTKAHPKWRLKASQGNPYLEALGFPMPTEGINL
jgi:hypothetical protein